MWQLAEDVDVLAPDLLRASVRDRAAAIASRHS
jgi:hypothetical protein